MKKIIADLKRYIKENYPNIKIRCKVDNNMIIIKIKKAPFKVHSDEYLSIGTIPVVGDIFSEEGKTLIKNIYEFLYKQPELSWHNIKVITEVE